MLTNFIDSNYMSDFIYNDATFVLYAYFCLECKAAEDILKVIHDSRFKNRKLKLSSPKTAITPTRGHPQR